MQRRGFLGLLGAVVAAPRVAFAQSSAPTYGYLTPGIVTARGYDNASVHVVFNGVDVTSPGRRPFGAVMACDDREGWIEVFAKDWADNYRRDPHDPTKLARERRYGHVRVTMARATPP